MGTARRKRMNSFLAYVFGVFVIGLGVAAGKSLSTITPQPAATNATVTLTTQSIQPSTTLSPTSVSPTPSTSPLSGFSMLVLAQNGTNRDIVLVDSQTKNRRVVFTDKDRSEKIKQVGNSTADGKELIAILGNSPYTDDGALVSISTDGSGQVTTLVSEFATPSPPVISPDGKKIAYIIFNNTEKSYGFFLVVMDRDGKNSVNLVQEKQAITQPVFSAKGDQLAYLRESAPKGTSIMTVPVAGGTPHEVVKFTDRVPYDLAWAKDTRFAFVDGVAAQADVYIFDNGSKDAKKISTPKGRESHPVFSANGKKIAYSISDGSASSIYVYDQDRGSNDAIGTGSLVIGILDRR